MSKKKQAIKGGTEFVDKLRQKQEEGEEPGEDDDD